MNCEGPERRQPPSTPPARTSLKPSPRITAIITTCTIAAMTQSDRINTVRDSRIRGPNPNPTGPDDDALDGISSPLPLFRLCPVESSSCTISGSFEASTSAAPRVQLMSPLSASEENKWWRIKTQPHILLQWYTITSKFSTPLTQATHSSSIVYDHLKVLQSLIQRYLSPPLSPILSPPCSILSPSCRSITA